MQRLAVGCLLGAVGDKLRRHGADPRLGSVYGLRDLLAGE